MAKTLTNLSASPFVQAQVAAEEAKVTFDINQKVFVFIENKPLDYIPCMSVSPEDMVSRIPHMSWIVYRGLVRMHGVLFMRFIHNQAQVYVGMGFLPYLENIPQRDSWGRRFVGKANRPRTTGQVKPRGMRARRKPGGIRRKLVKKAV